MTRILAADIGGTKTLLQLSEYDSDDYQLLYECRYASQDYDSFDDVLSAFMQGANNPRIEQACFAIAGPIAGDGASATVTNLPWTLDRERLRTDYAIAEVRLINDFHAVAAALDSLPDDELVTLQQGRAQAQGAQLVIGAGTGLGVAMRIWNGRRYQIVATEAGHAGFAPADQQQRRLLEFAAGRHPVVSREHLLSGLGLVTIYQFICQQQRKPQVELGADEISRLAADGDQTCTDCLALFFNIYGSECANLALVGLPFGGIYIAGGIAAKNIDALVNSDFVQAFCHKSKMHHLLSALPIKVIKNQSVGLLGARRLASHPHRD